MLHLRAQFLGAGKTSAIPEQILAHAEEAMVLHHRFVMSAVFAHDVETVGKTHGRLCVNGTDAAQGGLHLFLAGEEPWISLRGLADKDAVHLGFLNTSINVEQIAQIAVAEQQRSGAFGDLGCLRRWRPSRRFLCILALMCGHEA